MLSIVDATTSTLEAVSNEDLANPAGTDAACSVNVSVAGSKFLIVTSPSIATGDPSTNLTS